MIGAENSVTVGPTTFESNQHALESEFEDDPTSSTTALNSNELHYPRLLIEYQDGSKILWFFDFFFLTFFVAESLYRATRKVHHSFLHWLEQNSLGLTLMILDLVRVILLLLRRFVADAKS